MSVGDSEKNKIKSEWDWSDESRVFRVTPNESEFKPCNIWSKHLVKKKYYDSILIFEAEYEVLNGLNKAKFQNSNRVSLIVRWWAASPSVRLDRWVVGRWLFWFKVLSNSLLSEWLPGIGEKLTLFPVSFFILRCWNCESTLVGLSIRKCRILIAEYGKGELHLSEKGSL